MSTLNYHYDCLIWTLKKRLVSRVQNWGPVRDSGARSIEGVFL